MYAFALHLQNLLENKISKYIRQTIISPSLICVTDAHQNKQRKRQKTRKEFRVLCVLCYLGRKESEYLLIRSQYAEKSNGRNDKREKSSLLLKTVTATWKAHVFTYFLVFKSVVLLCSFLFRKHSNKQTSLVNKDHPLLKDLFQYFFTINFYFFQQKCTKILLCR